MIGGKPIESIRNSRKSKACAEVLAAFSGPPKKSDPTDVKLRETGWAIVQRVFHPPEVWLTKDANAFISKNFTLIPEQRKELESDLVRKSFLKDYEKNPGYKASFGFKT